MGASRTDDGTVLAVNAAACGYGQTQVLRGLDLTLTRGQIYVLLGPNGAGKTTLVRTVSGRLALSGGTVELDGRNPLKSSRARRALGLVPQEIALYMHLTARENLLLFGRLMGVRGRRLRDAVADALERIGLADRAHTRTRDLSGGMQRRVNIAAGILHRPKLLVLDEPTVGVDVQAREGIHELLRSLRRDDLAILLTTHDMEQAETLADRVGIILNGRIRTEGAPQDLIRDAFGPANELIVVLKDEPGERGRSMLGEMGMVPAPDERTWIGGIEGGYEQVPAVSSYFARHDLPVEEIRVREPGLRGVLWREMYLETQS